MSCSNVSLVKMARHYPVTLYSQGNDENQYISEFMIPRHADIIEEIYLTGVGYNFNHTLTLIFAGQEFGVEEEKNLLTNQLKVFYNENGECDRYFINPYYEVRIRVYSDIPPPKKMMLVVIHSNICDISKRKVIFSLPLSVYVKTLSNKLINVGDSDQMDTDIANSMGNDLVRFTSLQAEQKYKKTKVK